ncbi:MAG: MqnA/MqnD/SBP family protein [Bacteroidota bacterium]
MTRTIRMGHSPDPDDAFMFYGLVSGHVPIDNIRFDNVLEDIQSLNQRALRGELEVTAISAHAYPYIADRYWVMKTGASMGDGYGPIMVSRNFRTVEEIRGKLVGTPGPLTTATLLFKLFTEGMDNIDMPFDYILEALNQDEIDAGVLIHEGQITYESMGFHKILDFWEIWNGETKGRPLPLGLDVIRKDLGEQLAAQLSSALRQSIEYGFDHEEEAVKYALQYGRGMDRELCMRFIKMYVNQLTVDMGKVGRESLEELYTRAFRKQLIRVKPTLHTY